MLSRPLRWSLVVLLVIILSFTLTLGCAQDTEPEDPPADEPPAEEPSDDEDEDEPDVVQVGDPVYGGTLKKAVAEGLLHIDTNSQNFGGIFVATQYFYETLFERQPDGSAEPWLVRDYDISMDGLTMDFYLEPDVLFHDGTEFNAEAVKYNLDRKITYQQSLYDLIDEFIDEMEVIDELHLRLHLTAPAPHLIPTLASKTFAMYSPTWVEENSAIVGLPVEEGAAHGVDEGLSMDAVGTGPFIVKDFEPNDYLTLERNPNYWREGLPYLDGIDIIVVPDVHTAAMMLRAGEVDVTGEATMTDLEEWITTPMEQDGIAVQSFDSAVQYYAAINNLKWPTDDVRVRRAINYATDKEGMIYSIFRDFGATLSKCPLVTPAIEGYVETGYYPWDPDKAADLMAEAGYTMDGAFLVGPDGNRPTLNYVTTSGRRRGDYEIAEIVQANLQDIGIPVRLTVLEGATFVWEVTVEPEDAEYHLANMSWGTFTGDARYPMNMFFHTSAWAPRYFNRSYFSDSRVDELVETGNVQPTIQGRNEYYKDALQIAFDEAAILQMFQRTDMIAYRSHVGGITADLSGADPTTALYPIKFCWDARQGQ